MDVPALPPLQSTVPALVSTVSTVDISTVDISTVDISTVDSSTVDSSTETDTVLSDVRISHQVAAQADTQTGAQTGTQANTQIQPTLLSQSQPLEVGPLPMDSLPKVAISGIRALDFSFFAQPAKVSSRPIGWLPSTQLTHSFSFMSRAFRSARLDSALRVSQFSAAVPIQWARSNDWKSWAATAEVKISPVAAKSSETESRESPDWASAFVSQCQLSHQPSERKELSNASVFNASVFNAPVYRLELKETTLGYVADRDQAYLLAQQLERLLRTASFEADEILPRTASKSTASKFEVAANDQTLLSIDDAMAESVGYSKEWAAIAWTNNLRAALETKPLGAGAAQMALKGMEASNITLKGDASWYGPYFHGRATANGETYNQHDLTVAHKSLPFGTYLKVRNLHNDRSVVVRVNDRGPYVGDRSLDLSNAAAKCLGSDEAGVIPYEAVILNEAK